MSVQGFLRCTIRLERKHRTTHVFQQRALSGADAINALRPFYYAVHPDFFGQHPVQREVNENSLKRLNGYLETLQKPGSACVPPEKLTFYMRDTKGSSDLLASGFRSVTFVLHTNDVLSTVTNVLKSCSLPVEHMQALESVHQATKSPSGGTVPFHRPSQWDKIYYTFTGFRDPAHEPNQTNRVEPALSSWLQNNQSEARKRCSGSLPRREELKRLKRELCHKLDLADIRWQRGWGVAHRCSQLQSLSRLSVHNLEATTNLQGHTVVFADQSGMNACGHVMLGTMDVHHQWSQLIQHLPSYCRLQKQTEWLEERIGLLLGGTRVVHTERLGPVRPVTELYSTLNTFHSKLISQRLSLHPRSLEGLTMMLEKEWSRPSLHEMGHFIIPADCDPPNLQAFLQSHASKARQQSQRRNLLLAEEEAVMKMCLQSLALRTLSKEPSVTSSQMILCCERLLDQRSPLMQGLHVRVSHFYSLMQDGDLCIPWDWEG